MNLTESNYYTNHSYMSASQFKAFDKCEAHALANINGEWEDPKTEALLIGSYVDAMLTEPEVGNAKFFDEYGDRLFKKNGDKYQFVKDADIAIERIKSQPYMMDILSGEHQTIMTGEIESVPVKGKFDSYKPGKYIADLKYLKSLRSPNLFESIVTYYGYQYQGAIYQELVRQATGEQLPFYLVIATKETVPRLAVAQIPQVELDDALDYIRKKIKRFDKIKRGEIKPNRCGTCDYCAATAEITSPIDSSLLGMSSAQINKMKGII